jgi:DNA-binding ferritin-like protein
VPAWGWILIGIAVVCILAATAWYVLARQRSERLRSRFGPEYDRALGESTSKREAEAELRAREERRAQFDIRPLSPAARERYVEQWQAVQAQFVDDPENAVSSADGLIRNVMADRGYPVDDFDQRAADLSVDHPAVVENYREANRLTRASNDADRTENLRQAMRHYRALFEELVDDSADAPLAGDENVAYDLDTYSRRTDRAGDRR